MKNVARAPGLFIALGLSLGSAACAPQPLDQRAPITVPYSEMHAEYVFQNGSAILSDAQRSRLASFLQQASLTSTDAIFVTIPMTGIAAVDSQRLTAIEVALSRTPGRISLSRKTDRGGNRNIGLLRVVRAHGTARVDCTPGVDDLGCASRQNLAATLYQPSDAITPARVGRRALQ